MERIIESWEERFHHEFMDFYFSKETFEPNMPMLRPNDVEEWTHAQISSARADERARIAHIERAIGMTVLKFGSDSEVVRYLSTALAEEKEVTYVITDDQKRHLRETEGTGIKESDATDGRTS